MSWTDWINVISQGADIASKILPLVLESTAKGGQQASEDYVLGAVHWTPFLGKVYASNPNASEQGVTFAISENLPSGGFVTKTEFIPIVRSGAIDVTQELYEYEGGQVTIAPTDIASGVGDPIYKAIALSIASIGLAVAARILGNATVSVGKLPDGTYGLKFTNDNPMTSWKFKATVKDNKGNSATVSAEASSDTVRKMPGGNYEFDISLPTGVSVDPICQELDLEVDIPQEEFARMTESARSRVRTMAEIGLRPAKAMSR